MVDIYLIDRGISVVGKGRARGVQTSLSQLTLRATARYFVSRCEHELELATCDMDR